jgi:hypothetical protein
MDAGTHARHLFVFVWLCLTHQPKGGEFVGEDAKLSQNKGASGPTDGSAAVPRAAWLQITATTGIIRRRCATLMPVRDISLVNRMINSY